MTLHQITAEAVVDAPAEVAYAIIADYRDGHPRIIPRPPFVSLEVEQGGTGAGTVIRFQMRIFGRTRTFRAAITEPEPGRVLAETDLDTGAVTTFTVVPIEDGRKSRVTITTRLETRGGPLGRVERFVATRLLRPVYHRELERLGAVASERSRSEG
jgi:hypothetical protein